MMETSMIYSYNVLKSYTLRRILFKYVNDFFFFFRTTNRIVETNIRDKNLCNTERREFGEIVV